MIEGKLFGFLFVFLFFWLFILSFYLYNLFFRYRKLTHEGKNQNLRAILEKIMADLETSQKETQEIKKQVERLSEKTWTYVQRIGIVKFNPFADTGGEQSFVLAILDGKDNGIVLSSLYSRGINRWYIKKVKEGKGVDFDLSKEEKEAIKKAVIVQP